MEEEVAPNANILAWEFPWTEEPVGCSPWGPKRVGHNLANKLPPSCLKGFKYFGLQAAIETGRFRGELNPVALSEFL